MTESRLSIDRLTLSDLEVFPSGIEERGLFQLLDRTHTRGGREILRERLAAPFSEPRAIVAVQEGLRFLQDHAEPVRMVLESPCVEAAGRYLKSRYVQLQTLKGVRSQLAARWIAWRYPDLLLEARQGTAAVRTLVGQVAALCHSLAAGGPHSVLSEVLASLERAGREVSAVLQKHGNSDTCSAVLRLDAVLRGTTRPRVAQCLQGLYHLDALVAMAESTRDLEWVFPEVIEDTPGVVLEVAGLYHPLLERPVANDLHLDAESSLMFLTGPNMAGKTTLMRAAGLAVYLAQLGMGVPARSMHIAPFSFVISGISPVDSARSGCSHFLSEVRRLRQAAEALATGKRTLLLFDEIFRGTNFHDALEASFGVVEAFARCGNGATIISSHAAELLPRIEGLAGVTFNHFDLSLVNGAPHYSYRLETGAYAGRMAMILLTQEKLLDALGRLPEASARRSPSAIPGRRFEA
jgi:DNA mismatch repair protein MutS